MDETVRYILTVLLYGHESALRDVAYVASANVSTTCRVTIVGNGLQGDLHYPVMEHPRVDQLSDGRYIVYTDVVYNTFFFLSRAEEVLNPQRDEHGRFLAAYSLLRENDLCIPLIDEYSRLLCKLLDLPLPEPGFEAIHLTHDIDTIAYYRHFRGIVGGIKRGAWKAVRASLHDIHSDPAYTFDWMMAQDAKCIKRAQCTMQNAACNVICFVKDTPGKGKDYPQYNLRGKDYLTTAQHMLNNASVPIRLGLHSSSYEQAPLALHQDAFGVDYTQHRSHYLACSIARMQQLVEAGVTDDYTMGFADCAGFRLQTTRAVQWIHPLTRQVTPLRLHPLTIMDCTLSNSNYMHLNEDEAFFLAQTLIEKIRQHHGEVNLLWHNSVFDTAYHTSLYPRILDLI